MESRKPEKVGKGLITKAKCLFTGFMNDRDSIDRQGAAGKGDRHRGDFAAYQNSPFWNRKPTKVCASKQCQFAQDNETQPQCTEPATRKFGDHWFCKEHGKR